MASRSTLGDPIPAFTEHAISVSLPKWADNVGYEEGESRVIDAMKTGYPRFFIHLNIRKVSNCCRLLQPGMTMGSPLWKFSPYAALLHPGTEVWHTVREIAAVPIPQIRRGMPHIPDRTRRLRPRRAALHLRGPQCLPRALPRGQVRHRQAVLAAHRPWHLQPTRHTHPRHPRVVRVAPSDTHAHQAHGASPLFRQAVAPFFLR